MGLFLLSFFDMVRHDKHRLKLNDLYPHQVGSFLALFFLAKNEEDQNMTESTHTVQQCTVFRKAYILSASSFHKFLYSIIESLKKIREIAEFIPNQLRFHEKNFS